MDQRTQAGIRRTTLRQVGKVRLVRRVQLVACALVCLAAARAPDVIADIKLSGPMVDGGDVWSFPISPDGHWVVYIDDQDTDEVFEL